MELTREELESTIQKAAEVAASKAVKSCLTRMVNCNHGLQIEPVYLENYTDDAQALLNDSDLGGLQAMAHKYQQRVKVGQENGKDVYKWACGETPREFQESIYRIYSEYGLLSTSVQPIKSGVLFSEYAWEYFNTFKRSKLSTKAITAQENIIKNHVAPAFGNCAISDIKTSDIQKYLNNNSGFSKSYMRDIMALMKQVFNAALEDGLIDKNPMDSSRITNPCKKKTERQALSDRDKADIIAHISDLKNRNDRMFMAFLMFTAMRPGEIYALKWENIDVGKGIIHVRQGSSFTKGQIVIGKTKTEAGVRDIPLHAQLLSYLQPLGETGYIMVRESGEHKGEPYTEQAHKRAWERIKKTIDVHGMTPYCARHTYLTELCHNGVDMSTAVKIAGHADERMLSRVYVHTHEEHVAKAGKVMDEFFCDFPAYEAVREA